MIKRTVFFLAVILCSCSHNAPTGQPPLASLTTQSLEAFRADFNRAGDHVRLVLLLSPT